MVTWDLITPRSVLLAIYFSTQEFMFNYLINITVPNSTITTYSIKLRFINQIGEYFNVSQNNIFLFIYKCICKDVSPHKFAKLKLIRFDSQTLLGISIQIWIWYFQIPTSYKFINSDLQSSWIAKFHEIDFFSRFSNSTYECV